MEWPPAEAQAASNLAVALVASSQAISHPPSQVSAAYRNLAVGSLLAEQALLELVALNLEAAPSLAAVLSLELAHSAVPLEVVVPIPTATSS